MVRKGREREGKVAGITNGSKLPWCWQLMPTLTSLLFSLLCLSILPLSFSSLPSSFLSPSLSFSPSSLSLPHPPGLCGHGAHHDGQALQTSGRHRVVVEEPEHSMHCMCPCSQLDPPLSSIFPVPFPLPPTSNLSLFSSFLPPSLPLHTVMLGHWLDQWCYARRR